MADSLELFNFDDKEIVLYSEKRRLKTFLKKWPNDPDWACTPEKVRKDRP